MMSVFSTQQALPFYVRNCHDAGVEYRPVLPRYNVPPYPYADLHGHSPALVRKEGER